MTHTHAAPPLESRSTPPAVASARASLFGMPLDPLTEAGALALITQRLNAGVSTWILTPNLDILRQYKKQPQLRSLFHAAENGADILLADGMPLLWACKISGRKPRLPERVAGSTLVLSLARAAAENNWKLFLLGAAPGDAVRAAAVLQARYKNLTIAGTHCPPAGFENNPRELALIEERLAAAKPDLVYVALGSPKQEFLIRRLRPALPAATFIGVGISVSFIAGTVTRAPRWLQRFGLEWIHRLFQEPKRLAKRYLLHDIPFALFTLFPHALAQRFRRQR